MPITINLMQGRRRLPASRAFVLPEWFAWFANILSVIYIIGTVLLDSLSRREGQLTHHSHDCTLRFPAGSPCYRK